MDLGRRLKCHLPLVRTLQSRERLEVAGLPRVPRGIGLVSAWPLALLPCRGLRLNTGRYHRAHVDYNTPHTCTIHLKLHILSTAFYTSST